MKVTTLIAVTLAALVFTGCSTTRGTAWKNWGLTNTVGTHLRLNEVERQKSDAGIKIIYNLEASGFPKGKMYAIWWKRLGQQPVIISKGYYVNDTGEIVYEKNLLLRDVKFQSYKNVPGEPVEFALISDDQTVSAYAKAIPFPIEAKEGSHRLWVELASPGGEFFDIECEGFEPGEKVQTISKSEDEIIQNTDTISAKGTLSVIMLPAVIGKQSGTATFTVIGKSCNLSVHYKWGPAAVILE